MRRRFELVFLISLLISLLNGSAWADLLYDNGPINFNGGAFNISTYWVSDSFILNSASVLTEVKVGLMVYSGTVPDSVDWKIGTTYNGSTFGSGSASFTSNAVRAAADGYEFYESIFPLSLALGSDTYWLTLHGAAALHPFGFGPCFWNQNNGPSSAWGEISGSIPSESFQIYGTTSAVPEPTTMLLLGSGLIGLVGYGRRAFFKK